MGSCLSKTNKHENESNETMDCCCSQLDCYEEQNKWSNLHNSGVEQNITQSSSCHKNKTHSNDGANEVAILHYEGAAVADDAIGNELWAVGGGCGGCGGCGG